MADNLFPRCIVCGCVPEGGIRDGIVIETKFLCAFCMEDIVGLTTDDEDYAYFYNKLKQFWLAL